MLGNSNMRTLVPMRTVTRVKAKAVMAIKVLVTLPSVPCG